MRKLIQFLLGFVPTLSSCDRNSTEPALMSLDFNLSEGNKTVFQHTFETSRAEGHEVGKDFSITHQVVPDKAEIYDEVCQVIIKISPDDYTIAAHVPIHESESDELLEVGPYRLVFRCSVLKQ